MSQPEKAQPGWAKPYNAAEVNAELAEAERTRGFRFDDDGDLVIEWGGYDYEILASRIDEPMKLLEWIAHLGEKGWANMTPQRVGRLVEVVCQKNGWRLWGNTR